MPDIMLTCYVYFMLYIFLISSFEQPLEVCIINEEETSHSGESLTCDIQTERGRANVPTQDLLPRSLSRQ